MSAINSTTGSQYSSQDQCLFFKKIPAELRNEIYSSIIPVDSNVAVCAPWFFSYDIQKELTLGRTCRRMNDEVSALYFGTNRFCCFDGFALYMFLHNIGPINRATITRLEFRWGGRCPKQQMLLLADCVNLKQLHIAIYRPFMEGATTKKSTIWNTYGLSTLRSIRGLPDLDLKVRQVQPGVFIRVAFRGIQPEDTKVNSEFVGLTRLWQIIPDAVIEQLEAVLKEELGRDRDPNARKMKKPTVVTRVCETSVLGAQLQLRPTAQHSEETIVLPKRRMAAELGEEKRRGSVKKRKNLFWRYGGRRIKHKWI